MQPINDINVDDVLKGLQAVEGANQYVIFNQDCIPQKDQKKILQMKKQYKCQHQLQIYGMELRSPDNDLEIIRIRTKAQSEYIISQNGDYTMIGIQLFGKAIEGAKLAATQEAQAAAEAEKAKKGEKETN